MVFREHMSRNGTTRAERRQKRVERLFRERKRLGKRLAHVRHGCTRWSQAEVAARLERPQSYVAKCEAGDRKVELAELIEFARLYDVPLETFLPGARTTYRFSTEPNDA